MKYGAFENCYALTSLTIPAGLTAEFASKFTGYSNLAVVLTGTGSISNSAFSGFSSASGFSSDCRGLTNVTIGDDITSIGQAAFSGCSGLASITIGAGVSSFWTNSFNGCTSLERIEVDPANATYFSSQQILYNRVLASVALVPQKISGSITIPEGITSIGERAFSNCTSLTGINVASTNSEYSSVNGVLFNKERTLLIQYPAGHAVKAYTIPDSVGTIGAYSFEGCTALTSVTIPNRVGCEEILFGTTLYVDGVSTIESNAFAGCIGLTSVTFKGLDIDVYLVYISVGSGIKDHSDYETDLLIDIIQFFGPDSPSKLFDFFSKVIFGGKIVTDCYARGFYDNAFPQGSSSGSVGNALKTAYLAGGAGTYTRTASGWTK
jgi:hypothetical protein